MPQVLAMGVTYNEFWTLNPRKLKVLIESYRLKRQVEDEKQWIFGGYLFEAVSIAVGNNFRKKNQNFRRS